VRNADDPSPARIDFHVLDISVVAPFPRPPANSGGFLRLKQASLSGDSVSMVQIVFSSIPFFPRDQTASVSPCLTALSALEARIGA